MNVSDVEKIVLEEHERYGTPLPEKFKNPPELNEREEFFMMAFNELHSERVNGMSAGRIPWGAIRNYCQVYGFSDDLTEDVHSHLSSLDDVFVNFKKT